MQYNYPKLHGTFDDVAGTWVLDHHWWIDPIAGKYRLHIKAGYSSDGASVPWFLWSVVGPRYHPKTMPAALPHDALCDAEFPEVPRWMADDDFANILRHCGSSDCKARLYWTGVRMGSGYVKVKGIFVKRDPAKIAKAREFIYLEKLENVA